MDNMKQKTIIKILAGMIILLALVILYFFVISPKIDSIASDNQIICYNVAIENILSQLMRKGYVEMDIEGETIMLIPYNPNMNN